MSVSCIKNGVFLGHERQPLKNNCLLGMIVDDPLQGTIVRPYHLDRHCFVAI